MHSARSGNSIGTYSSLQLNLESTKKRHENIRRRNHTLVYRFSLSQKMLESLMSRGKIGPLRLESEMAADTTVALDT